TIPEGLTVEQALQRVADQEALTGDMPATLPHEGSIATDTLRFTRGATRQQMVDKLIADQKKLVEDVWSHRAPDLPIANIDDFVTLASIVEKETGRSDERSRVAAVFLNRLAKGMRLQSDPTIIYGLFGGKGKPADRPIYQSDLDKQTPYNTYMIKGLPPTPIANPGRAALEAVANPSKTDDLYFVADGNGGHVFAATLEEHNQNVARYRALQKKQADAAAKASGQTTAPATPDGNADGGNNSDGGENGDAGGDAAQ
ncbi:endolytic transglycosylase MltG, partial [Mesorhizobium sp. M2C.T.Ca.TU.002.02.1.1]|uniref:endolytic transglycosylase MltG n=1 Tax=Mesorhizobium sp. M2C.T.Ca.TU.002.02.1.1 TaxID=2496788 RepID=UPI000FCA4AB9